MTTKVINGAVTGGYTLSAAYTGVLVGIGGAVVGYDPILLGDGGAGLTLPFAANLKNEGSIAGGTGHQARYFGKFALPAGVGGWAVDAAAGSTVDNAFGRMSGGAGGAGNSRYGGGLGGTAIQAGTGSTITDSGVILGGPGGYALLASGLPGGAGGAGVDLASGRISVDGGSIYGGRGGADDASAVIAVAAAAGGAGGAGLVLEGAGIVVTGGTVFGERVAGGNGGAAAGGVGGAGGAGAVLAGGGVLRQNSGLIAGGSGGDCPGTIGAGGAGVEALARSVITTLGTIEGGAGGTGGSDDARSQGGVGVMLVAGGVLTNNLGLILGGYGCYGSNANGTGGGGGAGVVLQSGGTVVNSGSIAGGRGSTHSVSANSGGFGVWLIAGGTVKNTGEIIGGPTQHNNVDYMNVGVEIGAGGEVINGAPDHSTALIQGLAGINAPSGGDATVVNYGVIIGTQSVGHTDLGVRFGSHSDRLVVEAGSAIVGGVGGGGGTLELASGTGTISGLGVQGTVSGGAALSFYGFGTYDIDKASSWSLSGVDTVAAGQTMIDSGALGGSGTLAVAGGTVTFDAGARLATTHVSLSVASTVSDHVSIAYAGRWTQSAGILSVVAGQTATFTGAADSFAGALIGAGTIVFAAGADALNKVTLKAAKVDMTGAAVTLSGSIANASAVSLSGGKLIIAAAGAALVGTGSVSLSDRAANLITGATAASRLTIGQTLRGAGDLGGGTMVLVNLAAGVIVSQGVNALTIDTGAASITNAGLIESLGAGGLTIVSAVANTGRLYAEAATLTVEGAVTGAGGGEVLNGRLKATAGSVFNQNVVFETGATGALELAHGQTYAGQISGFSKTGATRLDLDDITFASGTTKAAYSGTTTGGVLTVTDGTHTAHIKFIGDYTTSGWTLSSDGHGGTTIVDPLAAGAPPAASIARLVAAAGSFGAVGSGPMQSGAEPRHAEPGHFLSVARFMP